MIYYLSFFVAVYLFFLVTLYLLPAGIFYWYINRKSDNLLKKKISKVEASKQDIYRDIKWSLSSLAVFAIGAMAMVEWINNGNSRMYYEFAEHSIFYTLSSALIAYVIFETYHYWMHRFMHMRHIFRYFHKTHHLSVSPTPWSMFAYSPLEAIVNIGVYPIIILILPLHPIVLGVFTLYVVLINAAGHTGIELSPKWAYHPLFKYSNRVSHHDLHHKDLRYNFGIGLNIWDRIANTFKDCPE